MSPCKIIVLQIAFFIFLAAVIYIASRTYIFDFKDISYIYRSDEPLEYSIHFDAFRVSVFSFLAMAVAAYIFTCEMSIDKKKKVNDAWFVAGALFVSRLFLAWSVVFSLIPVLSLIYFTDVSVVCVFSILSIVSSICTIVFSIHLENMISFMSYIQTKKLISNLNKTNGESLPLLKYYVKYDNLVTSVEKGIQSEFESKNINPCGPDDELDILKEKRLADYLKE